MPKDPLESVTPVRPVAPYLGGKRNLARTITAGPAAAATTRPRSEVINDIGRDVAPQCRILQRHYPQFLEVMRFQLTTRTEFERLVAKDPGTLTDLERAARFLYLQRTAFGGKVSGRNFGVSPDRPARPDHPTYGHPCGVQHPRAGLSRAGIIPPVWRHHGWSVSLFARD